MELWPGTLPDCFLTDGFNQQANPNAIRTKMEAGLDKLRRRYTTAIVNNSVSMIMTFTEYEALEAFFNTTLQAGTQTFSFTDPLTTDDYEYRFLEPPNYTTYGPVKLLVSMKWERLGEVP